MDRLKKVKSRKFVRHKKKNWRKYCDVSDIDNVVEEKRKQEATGLKPASERTDSELFCIDQESQPEEDQVRQKPRGFNHLKSERFAHPDTTVPPIMPSLTKTKKVVLKETRDSVDSSDEEEDTPKDRVYSRRSQALAKVIKGRKFAYIKKQIVSERMVDIWNCEDRKEPDASTCNIKSRCPVKRPGSSRRCPSVLNGLDTPHPGVSYNPLFTDHQRLLRKALAIEKEKSRNEKKLQRNLVLPKMTSAQRERQWQMEMLEGLVPSEDKDEQERGDSEGVTLLKRPIRASNRKTMKQRRKERITRKALKTKMIQQQEKLRMNEVYRIRTLKKDIRQEKEAMKSRAFKREEIRRKQELKKTKRLGKHPYEKLPIDLKLSREIVGSLRLLQSEGNSTRDRYNSILRRNMVVPKGPRNPTRFHRHKPRVRWVVSRAYDLRPDQMETK